MYVKGKTWPTTQSILKLMVISVEQKDLFINRGFFAVLFLREFKALHDMESVGHPLAAFI